MPLVTLTCSGKCYPPDDGSAPSSLTRPQAILRLAQDLPGIVVQHARELNLDAETPAAAVQVDIKRFHPHAVNSVDLWVYVQLTETRLSQAKRLAARDTLARALADWFAEHRLGGLSWALDMFYGPGHGCYANSSGHVEFTW